MLRAAPGAAVEAYTAGFATGLTGTAGVRVRDGVGADTTARTTSGIHEDIAGSGVYRVVLTAPTIAGVYWVIFDNGSGVYSTPEQLLVTSSAIDTGPPSGRDLCALADVLALAPAYALGDEPETELILQMLIEEQSRDFLEYTQREITPRSDSPSTRLFPVGWWECEQRRLLIDDAATVTAVVLVDDAGNVLQSLDSTAWTALPRQREDWQPYDELEFPRSVSTPAQLRARSLASVTGQWGFPSIPATVKVAVARFVLYRFLADIQNKGSIFADAADLNGAANPAASRAAALDVRARFARNLIG